MYTNQMRITGLSGLDTENMISQLMRAESLNLMRMRQKKQIMSWKQEAYVSAANTMKAFQANTLSLTSLTSLRLSTNLKGFTSTVKVSGEKSSAVSVKADTKAVGGSHTLEVFSIAKKAVMQGEVINAKLASTENLDKNSFSVGDSIRINIDGTTKEFTLDADYFEYEANGDLKTDVFASALKDAVEKAYGAGKMDVKIENNKLVFQASAGHTASVSSGVSVRSSASMGEVVSGGASGGNYNFSIKVGSGEATNLKITLEAGAGIADIVTKINEAIKDKGIAGVAASMNAADELVFTNANSNASIVVSDAVETVSGEFAGEAMLSGLFGGATATMQASNSLHNLGIAASKSTAFDMDATLSSLMDAAPPDSFTINGKTITIKDGADVKINTVKDLMNAINQSGAGVKMTFDSFASKFKLESNEAGVTNDINITGGDDIFKKVFNITTGDKQAATDAVFTLDGVETSRTTNTFTINGMTITLNSSAQPTGGATSVTFDIELEKDTSAVLDLVKNFVSEYNKMIEYLNKETKTARPKSDNYTYYEPLTDDEKKDLSEKEIELWEEKAKTGMLYRDDILQSITSQMRSTLYDAVDLGDGRKISLFQVGITVSSKLSDQGKLVIDEDKLLKMLENDGDAVAELFAKTSDISSTDKAQRNARLKSEGIAERLNDIITWATNTTSSLNVRAGIGGIASETSSDMYKKIRAQEEKISDMLSYLAKRETYYYQMFSRLEASMSQSDSQMAFLQSMMGL